MIGAAIWQIVAIDGSDHDMIQTKFLDHQRYFTRFFWVQCQRFAFFDGAKTATPRAGIAQDQESRGLVAPALADIGAACFLANRVKIFLPQDALQAEIVGISWRLNFDPVGMSARHKNDSSSRSKRSSRSNRRIMQFFATTGFVNL